KRPRAGGRRARLLPACRAGRSRRARAPAPEGRAARARSPVRSRRDLDRGDLRGDPAALPRRPASLRARGRGDSHRARLSTGRSAWVTVAAVARTRLLTLGLAVLAAALLGVPSLAAAQALSTTADTILISRAMDGGLPNGPSFDASISRDARIDPIVA